MSPATPVTPGTPASAATSAKPARAATPASAAPRRLFAETAWYLLATAYILFVLGWLAVGLLCAVAAHDSTLHQWAVTAAAGRHGRTDRAVGRGLIAGIGHSTSLAGTVLDYTFSAVNLVTAGLLVVLGRRDRTVRLFAIGMVGASGAFNLQAHASIEAMASAWGVRIGWWHSALLHGVGGVAYVAALLIFPDGRMPWRGSRPIRALAAVVVAGTLALLAVSTADYPHTVTFVLFFGVLTPVAGIAAQRWRLTHAVDAEQRQQSRVLLWALGLSFGVAAVLAGAATAARFVDAPGLAGIASRTTAFWIFRAVFTALPIAVLAGVLRFRLWDAERVFNKTLIYGSLVALSGAGWVFGVVRVDALFGLSNDWTAPPQLVGMGLLALAVQPVRIGLQKLADRLVYGRRTPPYEVLAAISAMSQLSGPADQTLRALARTVAEGLSAPSAAIAVTVSDRERVHYGWPQDIAESGDHQWTPLEYQGEAVGAIGIPSDAHRSLAPDRRRLLADVAPAAGVIVHNARLTIDLEHRLRRIEALSVRVRASRRRIVAAQDGERRELERDLHDGAQPELTAVRLALGLLAHAARRGGEADPEAVRAAAGRAVAQTEAALAGLHRTMRGLDPRTLGQEGLVAALRERAENLDCTTRFEFPEFVAALRFERSIEAAVYYCCSEAMQNAAKHCPGTEVVVSLSVQPGISPGDGQGDGPADGPGDGSGGRPGAGTGGRTERRLAFAVTDSGPGFDVDAAYEQEPGGLVNMADRIAAAGGEVRITSVPESGTTVMGWVPCP
ncbi:signal transduction histidine kinase [Catenulispora sp. MAP12-49]|uniref:sensor histidine kinase n=1 Tax=Catenulispora sp. MAP12-49 TaxID=3156302 RepID=UPI003518EC1C